MRKAVLFDLFGTLVNSVTPADYDAMLRAVAGALGAPAGAFSAQWRAEIEVRESGRLGALEEVLASTSSRVGHVPAPESVARAADTWLAFARRWLAPREYAVETINAFRDAGYRVGLISNCSAEVPWLWPELPFSRVIEAPVFSCEAGVMKPDPAIYHRACSLLDVPPQQSLFIGDGGSDELTGAAALGMTAILLRVPGEEHTWFDATYRRDALQWQGESATSIEDIARYI